VVIDGGSTTDGEKLIIDGIPTLVGAVPTGGYEVVVNGDEQVSGTLTVNAFSATTLEADNGYFHNLGGYVPGTPINLVDDIYGSYAAPAAYDVAGTGVSSHMNNVIIGNTTPVAAWFTTLNSSGNTALATGAGSTTAIGTTSGGNVTVSVNSGTTNLMLDGIATDLLPQTLLTLNASNQVRQTPMSGTADQGVIFNTINSKYELGGATNTDVPFYSNRYINAADNTLNITDNGGANLAAFDGGTDEIDLNNVTDGNTNIGNAGTVSIQGTTDINTSGTALTSVGAGGDQQWLAVNGTATTWTTPANQGVLPTNPLPSLSDYEAVVNGDEEVTGTIYTANLAAGNIWATLMSAPAIAFNTATSYSPNTSMTFNTSSTTTPTITVNGPSASGVYAEQVNGGAAAGSNGVQITGGVGGGGVGLNIDPFGTGIAVLAGTTGETLNGGTTGLKIGNITAPTTGETITTSTGDGLDITSGGNNSISANKLITTLTNVNTGGASGVSTGTTGLYQIGGSTVLSNPGTQNILVGVSASSAGSENTVVGFDAAAGAGSENTLVGDQANSFGFTGNTSIGYESVTDGADGVAVGTFSFTEGDGIALGYEAEGYGLNAMALGFGADAGASNATAIGNGADVFTANEIQLGNTSVTLVNTTGNLTTSGGENITGTGAGGAANINLAGTGNTFIGNTGNTTTIAGPTNINTADASTTTIGETGADVSTTVINVGNTGSLTLNNIPSTTTNTNFLTLSGTNSGTVSSDPLSNFIQGSNGVWVNIVGGVATAQFSNAAGTGTGGPDVAFQSARYINTAAFSLNITDNNAGTVFATFNGNNDAINLNTGTAGNTLIGNTGNVTINGATNSITATTANTIVGTTTINQSANFNTSIATGTSTGTVTVGNVANSTAITLDGLTTANPPSPGAGATNTVTISNSPDGAGTWSLKASSALTDANNSQGILGSATSVAANSAVAGQFNATGVGATNTSLVLNASGVSTTGNIGSNTTVSSASPSNTGAKITVSGSGTQNTGEDISTTGASSTGVKVEANAVTGISIEGSNGTGGNGATANAIQINNLSSNSNGLAITLNNNGGLGVSSTTSINLNMVNGIAGSNRGLRIQNLANSTDHGIDIGMTNGVGIDFSTLSSGTGIQVDALGSATGMHIEGTSAGTGVSVDGATGTGTALLISAGTNTQSTGISVGGVTGNGSDSYSSVNGSAVNVTSGEVRNSAPVQTIQTTASNQFAGRVLWTAADVLAGSATISNNLAQADNPANSGTGSTIIITFDGNGGPTPLVSYICQVQQVNNGNFVVTCSSPNPGYINYIIINH
jgi:hypothetical protein